LAQMLGRSDFQRRSNTFTSIIDGTGGAIRLPSKGIIAAIVSVKASIDFVILSYAAFHADWITHRFYEQLIRLDIHKILGVIERGVPGGEKV
jgi:hypothetical protein